MEVSALIISLCSLAIQIKQYRNDHPQNRAHLQIYRKDTLQ